MGDKVLDLLTGGFAEGFGAAEIDGVPSVRSARNELAMRRVAASGNARLSDDAGGS